VSPRGSEVGVITYEVEMTADIDSVVNQGVLVSTDTPDEPTDDPDTPTDDDPTVTRLILEPPDIRVTQQAVTSRTDTVNGRSDDFADEAETYTIMLTIENIGETTARDIVVRDVYPDSVIATNMNPDALIADSDSIVWNIDSLAPQTSEQLQFDVTIPDIMPFGLNLLSNQAHARAANEDPGKLDNNTSIDTVFNYVEETPVLLPQIEAIPATVDVTDSIVVSVNVPQNTVSWDLWVYRADNTILEDFGDDYISTVQILPDTWSEVDERYRPLRLLTEAEEEPVIFEIRTVDIRGRDASAQATVTVTSSDYLVLDRNVFKPDIEDPMEIRFKLSSRRSAQLDVYDVVGRHILKMAEDVFDGGWNTYSWDGLVTDRGQKIGSGVYIVTLRAGGFKAWKKFIIIR